MLVENNLEENRNQPYFEQNGEWRKTVSRFRGKWLLNIEVGHQITIIINIKYIEYFKNVFTYLIFKLQG